MQSLPNDDPTKTCSHTNFLIGFFLAKHRLENSRTGKKGHGQVPAAKFDLGQLVATPGALAALEESGETARLIHFTTLRLATGATSLMTTEKKRVLASARVPPVVVVQTAQMG